MTDQDKDVTLALAAEHLLLTTAPGWDPWTDAGLRGRVAQLSRPTDSGACRDPVGR